jgi:hypothetical protein
MNNKIKLMVFCQHFQKNKIMKYLILFVFLGNTNISIAQKIGIDVFKFISNDLVQKHQRYEIVSHLEKKFVAIGTEKDSEIHSIGIIEDSVFLVEKYSDKLLKSLLSEFRYNHFPSCEYLYIKDFFNVFESNLSIKVEDKIISNDLKNIECPEYFTVYVRGIFYFDDRQYVIYLSPSDSLAYLYRYYFSLKTNEFLRFELSARSL